MSEQLVKLITDEDGAIVTEKVWHLVCRMGDSPRTVCTGEVFGYGEGAATYKTKEHRSGAITC